MPPHYLEPKSGGHPFVYEPPAARSDIFFITCDMIPPESYDPRSPMRQVLHTPNMDRLFAAGVRFSHACCTSPLCGPSRASYLTGRYSYMTVNEERAHDGWQAVLRPDDAIFPEYLRATGYVTKHAGKGHVGTQRFFAAFGENDSPWNRWAPPLTDDEAYVAYLDDLGVQAPVWPDPLTGLRPDRRTPGNSYGGWITQANCDPLPVEALYEQYLAGQAVRKLDHALRHCAPGQPLYLQLDFFSPHQPFLVPESLRDRARELAEHVRLPDTYDEALTGSADWPRVYDFYRRNWGLYDRGVARQYMVFNFLQIELLDEALGRFLRELDRRGLYDSSLLIFTGDHGEMNTERALIDKGVYGHPKVARVPLAVKLPSGEHASRQVDQLVSLLDLAPTILGHAGITPADRQDGQSLLPLIRGEQTSRPPFIFEAGWHVCPNPAVSYFAQVDGRSWMYTYNLTARDELYDMDDPTHRDVAADPAFADLKLQLIRELGAFLEADPRWTCYWHTFRLDKFSELGAPSGDFQMYKPG